MSSETEAGVSESGRGELFILSAPSGAGKTTLIQRILSSDDPDLQRIAFSVSYTTRQPRRGDEAVDPGAEDDHVVARHTDLEASSVFAASSPGAAIRPPPGCTPESQDQRPSSGVR